MSVQRRRTSATLTALLLCTGAPALAQQPRPPALTGSVSVGTRSVDVGGADTKFREDVNLDDGVRLFDASLHYQPAERGSGIDRLDLDATGLGGDPFETIHLGVRKYGAFDLKLDRRRSAYFYDDTILPAALASVTASTRGDVHRFDFERVRDSATLDVDLSPATQLSFGLEHQTRTGDSTTTLDLQRDEFELDKPLDESLNGLTVGLRHSWDHITLVVDEQLHDFENTSELILPGYSPGSNAADPAELLLFRADQSYDYTSRGHAVRLMAKPTAKLDVGGGWRTESVDLDMQANQTSSGTTFGGAPFTETLAGPAAVGRDITVTDFDFGYAIGDRVRVVANARQSRLSQDGGVTWGTSVGTGSWGIDTGGREAGFEYAVSQTILVSAGWSTETRTVNRSWTLDAASSVDTNEETSRDGYFARLLVHLAGGLELTASVEDNDINDPFALASPTASRRYKIGAKKRWSSGISINGSFRKTDVENDASGWLADTNQADVRVDYRRERLQLSAGYSRIELQRAIDQLVTAGTVQSLFAIAYDADSTLWDASARWRINERYSLGGELRTYDNTGSFKIARDDYRAFLDVELRGPYAVRIAYRDLDYTEDAYDNYDARLLEVALRLRW
jgi:hypothetical protein